MKRIFILLLRIVFIIVVSCITLSSATDKDQIEKTPIFKKGTFWKIKCEQLTDYTGKKITNNVTNLSCYIDSITKYNGIEVYKATFLNIEQQKVATCLIDKSNLKIILLIAQYANNKIDTLSHDFALLNFPLFLGKKWNSICKYEKMPRRFITTLDSKFEVVDVRDTTLKFNGDEIKTKAFYINGIFMDGKRKSIGNYLYLAPNKEFPGSCPIFLWDEFLSTVHSENDTRDTWNYTMIDFNW